MSKIRFLVLGAAAGGGLPQWNCNCANCAAARDPSSGLSPQTQSSLAVSVDGDNWAIFNASPDIRQQIQQTPQLHPKALRQSPIRSIVITNADVDHIGGLLTVREKQPFKLFATSAIEKVLDGNPIFRVLDPDHVTRQTIRLDSDFSPLEGLQVRIFAVPGKVALFLEEGEPELGLEGEQTIGVEFTAGGKRAYYIPGCATLPDWLAERIRGADLVFFDGTLFANDEMVKAGTGAKTGQRMGHMSIDGPDGSLAQLSSLNIGRLVYVHINNTNPIWRNGPERAAVEAAGFAVGCDGMEIELA
ncbi:coenzyme PQQ synthesis protein B [Rhizobium wenxiniae]|uniref:Coenzyme PQQ synthesis protein B n=1 Tax=Rhizobium wenxiniae TaxID=1737357 RepID=A0A7X0D3A1_9HYPH|nr:pyrroloquinoline quinone biosynthesis protein PqqB [Rhizobium wenxiniae]MBB6165296.1 pyrroloquinoline quinone biosynthesis protein B [Rhizobium wenxiniae]GGG14309.1 coenzyme PQQ synthesis protein B [Rhizobium wenxiniae]